jgi:hypothetical protein
VQCLVRPIYNDMASASIPKEMKAQILESYNTPYTFKTVTVPQVSSEHDILIRVDAAGYDINLECACRLSS